MSLSTSGRTWEEASSPAAVRLCRRFEEAWRRSTADGPRPDPNKFLDEAAGGPGARLALLRADMSLRWEAGEKVNADWYRDRHADLGEETLVALIYEEFCLREEGDGDGPPDPDDYLTRYPEVAGALRRVLDIHGLVGSETSTGFHAPAAPAVPFPAAGETIAGFRLVEELGRGAFARVFLAQERQLADRPVALKVARSGSREPQTLARLQHTHIVPVHSYRTDPATGLHLLCMPYFGRVTLAQVLADPKVRVARSGAELVAALDRLGAPAASQGRSAGRSALSRRSYVQAVAWWGARMAEALEHAHDRGVLHRDVKPSNVLVTGDGMPMLLDFNLAREAVAAGGEAERSVPGGTLDYMAPEHLEALADGLSDEVDARSDVFGLGVLLYEALTGSRPFPAPRGAASATEMLTRAAEGRRDGPPRLRATRPDVPAAIEAVVTRCLEPDPDDRYPSAADLAADLQAVADDLPLRFAREPWPDRARRWGRRHRRPLAAALPLLLAAAGLAGLAYQKRLDHDRLWSKVKRLYDAGVASEAAGNPAQAVVQFQSAVRLVDRPESHDDPAPKGPGPSEVWSSLEELRQQANRRFKLARLTEEYRGRADALFLAADPLRFRLFGIGGELDAASAELLQALAPFHVFEGDDWLERPDLKARLDAGRKARLVEVVNELLFLWAVALDREGDTDVEARRKAVEVCDIALGFVRHDGPWKAMRAGVSWKLLGRPAPGPTVGTDGPSEADDASGLACFQWGVLRLRQAATDDAIGWFKRAVKQDEGNYFYHYYLAYALDRPSGNPVAALRHYDAAVALRPRSPWVRFTRARFYRLGKDWGVALEEFRRALDDFLALPVADRDAVFECKTRLELGLVRQSLGDPEGARREYAAVVAADPTSEYAYAARLNRAKLDTDVGAADRAMAEFAALLRDRPDDGAARVSRAMLALRTGDFVLAEADLSHRLAGAIPPADRAEAHGLRALARLGMGRTGEAAADAEEAMRARPSPAAERLLTRVRVAAGRAGEVTISRPEELAELPVNGPPLRADLTRLAGRLRADLAAGLVAVPKILEARMTLAATLAALGEGSAVAEANRAVALAPGSAPVYLLRARVGAMRGRADDARRDVETALGLETDDPRAYELRGRLLAHAGDLSAALADFDRAIALGYERASVHRERAAALMSLGDTLGAVGDWDRALAHDPDDPSSFLGRARAYVELGHWDLALADLEQAAAWCEGRPRLGVKVAATFLRCLPHRPQHAPRLAALAGRVWAEIRRSCASPVPNIEGESMSAGAGRREVGRPGMRG